jgi:hypothetical protein
MREAEALGVKELPLKYRRGPAVDGVAGDRVADRGQVNADLVGAAGLYRNLQQRVGA